MPSTGSRAAPRAKKNSRADKKLPSQAVLDEIDQKVNLEHLEAFLMEEGVRKFTEPQKALLALIASKRKSLAGAK